MPRSAKELAIKMEAMWNAADAEGRDLTPAERSQMEELVAATKSQHSIEQQIRELGGAAPSFVTRTDPNWSSTAGGPGDVFVKSAAYQKIMDPSGRGQRWTTGPVEVSSSQFTVLTKGTMLETTAGGPGGGMVPPMYPAGRGGQAVRAAGRPRRVRPVDDDGQSG
jgi:hypothetical protein